MMGVSRRSFRVWQRNRDVFLRLWHTETPGMFAEPLFVLLAIGLGLGAYVALDDSESYIAFIAPGIVAAYAMFSASFECTYGSFFRMKYQKTYDAIISTPLNIEDVVAGEAFWGATRSLITVCAILIVIAAFGLVESWWALAVLPLGLLAGLMFSSFALVFTALAPAVYSFNYYFTLFLTPMFFFSGVFFPLDEFPQLVRDLSWIAPLTSFSHLSRALIGGEVATAAWWSLGIMAGLTLVFFPLALHLMKRRLLR